MVAPSHLQCPLLFLTFVRLWCMCVGVCISVYLLERGLYLPLVLLSSVVLLFPVSRTKPIFSRPNKDGDGPNTVSESTVSNTKLTEFFGSHQVPGRELSELLSAYYLPAKANSPSFSQNSASFGAELSEFRTSTLETVFCLFLISVTKKPHKTARKAASKNAKQE